MPHGRGNPFPFLRDHALSRVVSRLPRKRRPATTRSKLPILSDVARQAAVSLTTASRALDPDNSHPVSDRTRARVQAAATRLSYRPNPMARALRTRRVPTIAIVVHDVSDPYFAEVVKGATSAASARGFLTVVCSSNRDPVTELCYVVLFLSILASRRIFAGGELAGASQRRARAENWRGSALDRAAILA